MRPLVVALVWLVSLSSVYLNWPAPLPDASEGLPICESGAVEEGDVWEPLPPSEPSPQYYLGDESPTHLCPARSLDHFVRSSGCAMLPLFEASCLLSDRRLHVLGDSTMEGLAGALHWLRRQAALGRAACGAAADLPALAHALRCSKGVLGTPGEWTLLNLLGVSGAPDGGSVRRQCDFGVTKGPGRGWSPFKSIYDEVSGSGHPSPKSLDVDALLVSTGVWWNLENGTAPGEAPFAGVNCLLRAFEPLQPVKVGDLAGAEALRRKMWKAVDTCAGAPMPCVGTPCHIDGLAEFAYTRQLVEFAAFVLRHRASLPALILWIEPSPQHFESSGLFRTRGEPCGPHRSPEIAHNTKWRNNIADAIFDRLWPQGESALNLSRIRTYDMMASRHMDHDRPPFDCTHYCPGSSAFHEHIASVLTELVRRLEPGGARRRRPECAALEANARRSPCFRLARASDRLASGQRMASRVLEGLLVLGCLALWLLCRRKGVACRCPRGAASESSQGRGERDAAVGASSRSGARV